MAYFYCDADTGSDANDGTSWAQAEATIEAAIADASAGDTIFVRANTSETTKDTAAASRTFTTNGTELNPMRIVGVKAGTTNEGASIVTSDLAVSSGDQPVIEVTGAGNDMTFNDYTEWSYIHFINDDRINITTNHALFYDCVIETDNWLCAGDTGLRLINCTTTIGLDGDAGSGFANNTAAGGRIEVCGGSLSSSSSHNYLLRAGHNRIPAEFIGVDLSGLTLSTSLANTSGNLILRNCRVDAGLTLYAALGSKSSVELIGCTNDTSITNTNSIQQYAYADPHGEIVTDTSEYRTGGASDGASGSFSYKLTPIANAVLEGCLNAALWTPWMRVWVDGGSSTTLTVYTTTDGAGDYTEEEMICQFFTPDAGDTATYDVNLDPAGINFFSESTTAITDDTGSTWQTANTYKQKFSTTVTPGYTGFAYARVAVCKRQASPDSVWVDPLIEVS